MLDVHCTLVSPCGRHQRSKVFILQSTLTRSERRTHPPTEPISAKKSYKIVTLPHQREIHHQPGHTGYSTDMRHIQYQGEMLPLVLAFHLVLGKFHIYVRYGNRQVFLFFLQKSVPLYRAKVYLTVSGLILKLMCISVRNQMVESGVKSRGLDTQPLL